MNGNVPSPDTPLERGIKSLRPSDAYMRQLAKPTLAQIKATQLNGA